MKCWPERGEVNKTDDMQYFRNYLSIMHELKHRK